jgi:hypothetical protein
MAIIRNSAEGGTNGTTVTTGNSGGTSGTAFAQVTITGAPTCVFSSVVKAHGSLGYHISGGSGDVAKLYLGSTASSAAAVRVYMYLTSLPSAAQTLVQTQDSAFAAPVNININGTNNLFITNAAGTTVYTAPSALSAATWYRLELQTVKGTTTSNGTISFQYYAGDSTTALGSFTSSTTNTGTNNSLRLVVGKQNSTPTLDAYFDDLAYDTTSTTIGPYTAPANQPPTAYAGPDQSNIEPWTTVSLDGSGSSDSDGTIASYAWTQTAGTSVTLSSNSAAQPTFTAPGTLAGDTLTFSLTVTDNSSATSMADTVDIAVLAATERAVMSGAEVPVHTQAASGGGLV